MSGHKETGLGAWIRLRMSAVALVPLTIWVVYSIIELKDAPYAIFTEWLQNPFNAALLIVFLLASFYHAVLGVQEIFEDYVSDDKTRNCALWLVRLSFVILTILSVLSIAKIAF